MRQLKQEEEYDKKMKGIFGDFLSFKCFVVLFRFREERREIERIRKIW